MTARSISPREHAAQFHARLDAVQQYLASMTRAIALLEFADAWIASCLVVYELSAAEVQLAELAGSWHYPEAQQRVTRMRGIASAFLPRAPLPSSTAIREMRSVNWTASRPEWEFCEREWRRRHHKPRIPRLWFGPSLEKSKSA